jgi:TonB family protein
MRGVRVLLSLAGLALAAAVGSSSAQESAPEPQSEPQSGAQSGAQSGTPAADAATPSPEPAPRRPADPAGRAYRPPSWRIKPSDKDWSAAYPEAANRRGLAGKATVRCQVTLEGDLAGCVVTDETPGGEGFGAAALQMTGHMRMTPAMLDGRPVTSRVVIPVSFQPAPEPLRPPTPGPGKSVEVVPATPAAPGVDPTDLVPAPLNPPPPRRRQPDWARITTCAALSLDEADRKGYSALTRDATWYAAYMKSGLERSKAPGALLARLSKAMDEARAGRQAPDRLARLRACGPTLRALNLADPARPSDP